MKRIAVILVAVLLASCGSAPGVTVSIAGMPIPMITSSTTEGTPCSTVHSDGFAQNAPLTTVRAPTLVAIHFEAGRVRPRSAARSTTLTRRCLPT